MTVNKGIIMRYPYFIFIYSLLQTAYSQDIYYPLSIGNRWNYSYEGVTTEIAEITGDTIMSNDKQYRILSGYDVEYHRFENNKVFIYDTYTEIERLQYDFSAALGDTILTFDVGEDTADIVVLDVDSMFIFGSWRRMWIFDYDWRHSTDIGWSNTIIDSIGLYTHAAFAGWFYLLGAEIEGRTYGVIDKVDQTESLLPNTIQLYQNYPNPFNHNTVISWQVAATCKSPVYIELNIYDILGQKVATLVSGKQKAGLHTIEWDASGMASGVYYYRLVAEEYVDIKKLVLLK